MLPIVLVRPPSLMIELNGDLLHKEFHQLARERGYEV